MENKKYKITNPRVNYIIAFLIAVVTLFFFVSALISVWQMWKQPLAFTQCTVIPFVITATLTALCSLLLYTFICKTFSLSGVFFHKDGKIELIHSNATRIVCSIPDDIVSLYLSKKACSLRLRCKGRIYVIGTDQLGNEFDMQQYLMEHIPTINDLYKYACIESKRDVLITFRSGQPVKSERV